MGAFCISRLTIRRSIRRRFRKIPVCRPSSQVVGKKRLPENAQTCLEGPFGELLRATGPMAKANPFRFSTKYQDDETDLVYYGYRYYGASTGRWITRDALGEAGGRALYVFAANQPLARLDPLGNMSIVGNVTAYDCGGFSGGWWIRLAAPAATPGYIVQHIRFEYRATTCDGVNLHEDFDYWEAMPVAPNQPGPSRGDGWAVSSSPGTMGNLTMKAEVKFFAASQTGDLGGYDSGSPTGVYPPWDPWTNYGGDFTALPPWWGGPQLPALNSGSFPSTGATPPFWNDSAIDSFTGAHFVTTSWKCCCPWNERTHLLSFP